MKRMGDQRPSQSRIGRECSLQGLSPGLKTESPRRSSVGSWTRSSDLSSILLPSALSRAATATWP
jgi:hypothetical protein